MGFTETEIGPLNAPLADRHSSAPAADRCTTWPWSKSATQQEPSVGFTETRPGPEKASPADRHSSVPAAERCTTWLMPVSATQQEPSVGFTETDCGLTNAGGTDRHASTTVSAPKHGTPTSQHQAKKRSEWPKSHRKPPHCELPFRLPPADAPPLLGRITRPEGRQHGH